MNNQSIQYVVWSEEHGAWWAPTKQGYTRYLKQAGRYSLEEAKEIVARANQHLDPAIYDFFCEVYLPDPTPPPDG